MNKHLFCAIFFNFFLLVGCATVSEPPVNPESAQPSETGIQDKPILPKVHSSLSPDLLYILLTAEIAGQKGAYDVALDSYLEAAKWTRDPKVAERATQIALFNKQQEKALEAALLWIERDPESISARKLAVILDVKQGNYKRGIGQLEFLESLSEIEFGKTIMEITKILEKDARKQQSLDFMDTLVNAFPSSADVYYGYGLIAAANRDLQLASQQISKAIKLRPEWSQARIAHARIVAQQGDTKTALAILQELVVREPDNEKLHMIYVQFLINLKDFPAAESELNDILEKNPKQYDALYSLALIKLQNEQIEDAQNLFLKLVDVPKSQAQAYFYLGRIAAKNKESLNAIAWFEKIVQGPLFLDAQANIASILAADSRFDEAIDRLHALRKRFPAEVDRLTLMEAELLNQQNDYEGAFFVLSRALEVNPDQPELLYTRALVAESLDRLDVLEQDLKQVLEKNPNDPNALNALGYTLADRTDRYDEAQQYLDRAIELRPDDPVILDSYGWLQYRLGDLEKAINYLQRAYDLNSDSEIAAHLGEVLWVMGREDEAKAVWLKSLINNPDSKHLIKMKKRFPAAFSE